MDFDTRLQKAIERGEKVKDSRGKEELERQLSQDELRTLHATYRLELSEHIEDCLKKLADHIPGFVYHNVMNNDGWGARITRDDLSLTPGKSAKSLYSRLELFVAPYSSKAPILEMVGKGTVRNREAVNRKNYQMLSEFDLDSFKEMVDLRVLEFAEVYTAE